LRALLLGVLLGLALPALAQQLAPAEAMLDRLGQALRQTSFEGVLVYSRDGQLDALRVRRAAGGRQELIERLTGPELPLQRSAAAAYLGGAEGLAFGDADESIAPTLEPDRYYRLEKLGEDRVAGRPAEVIDLRASDGLRFSRRYWVDGETGLLLRAAVFAGDGTLVEQWMFSSLELGEQAAPALPAPRRTLPVPSAAGIARTSLRVVDLPPGFALVSAAVAGDDQHLVFTDGLARVSLFAQPLADRAAVLSGHQRRGALSVFGRLYRGLQVVVVGEVPAATAERFAQSVNALSGG
jgi:sigma-E factor negative regulatory protein RseB